MRVFFFHMHKSKNQKLTELELLTLGANTMVTHSYMGQWFDVIVFQEGETLFEVLPTKLVQKFS